MIKVGDTIYRGVRYWVQEPTANQHIGWNTYFDAYIVVSVTPKQIRAFRFPRVDDLDLAPDIWDAIKRGSRVKSDVVDVVSINSPEKFLREGKIYHSRYAEYFYVAKPLIDPEKESNERWQTWKFNANPQPLSALGLTPPCTKDQIKRAYKRLAKQKHPDGGGSHQAFLDLQKAYEEAMRLV